MTTGLRPPDDEEPQAAVVPLWPDRAEVAPEIGTPADRGATHLWITIDPGGGPPEVRVLTGAPPSPLSLHGTDVPAVPGALPASDQAGEVADGVMRTANAPRVGLDESLPDALRRISLELFDHSITGFGNAEVTTSIAVHEARKAMKRIRAVLRLVRDTIGEPVYKPENVVLRDTARRLGGARDAAVLVQVVDGLTERFAGRLWPGAYVRLREALVETRDEQERGLAANRQLVADVVMCLGAARARYAAWPTASVTDEFESIRDGIRRVYRRGRKAMDVAVRYPSAANFHEWRKRVKYLRYQMEVLRELWPDLMEGIASSLAELAEDLGDEHDLATLADLVRKSPELVPRYHDRDLLLTVIEGRRAELQHDSRTLGRLVYHEPPDRFVERIGAYWNARR